MHIHHHLQGVSAATDKRGSAFYSRESVAAGWTYTSRDLTCEAGRTVGCRKWIDQEPVWQDTDSRMHVQLPSDAVCHVPVPTVDQAARSCRCFCHAVEGIWTRASAQPAGKTAAGGLVDRTEGLPTIFKPQQEQLVKATGAVVLIQRDSFTAGRLPEQQQPRGAGYAHAMQPAAASSAAWARERPPCHA